MMHRTSYLLGLIALALLSACGPSHELARYDFAGMQFHYRSLVASDAAQARIDIDAPAPTGGIGAIITGIGSDILSGEAHSKLNNAVRPAGVASAINRGVERTVTTYMSGKTADEIDDNTAFILETVLRQCDIVSRASGLFLRIKATSMLLDRRSGENIWDEDQGFSTPISYTPSGNIPVPGVGTAASVANAVRFFSLSEQEIQDAVLRAAADVGEGIGRKLREDYAESRKK